MNEADEKEILESVALRCNESLIRQLGEATHLVGEQTKIIENLQAENNLLRAPKSEPDASARLNFRFGKNKSYRQSVWFGVREGIVFVPLSFVEQVVPKIFAVLSSAILLPFTMLGWVLSRVLYLAIGFAGFLKEKDKRS